jgi:hypothetical protein
LDALEGYIIDRLDWGFCASKLRLNVFVSVFSWTSTSVKIIYKFYVRHMLILQGMMSEMTKFYTKWKRFIDIIASVSLFWFIIAHLPLPFFVQLGTFAPAFFVQLGTLDTIGFWLWLTILFWNFSFFLWIGLFKNDPFITFVSFLLTAYKAVFSFWSCTYTPSIS